MMIQVSSKHSPTDQSNWREVETKFKSLDASILGINTKLNIMLDYDFSGMVTQIEKNRVSVTNFLTTLEGVENISLRRDCSRYMYNDTWFNVRNNAGSANINIFKVDASDNIRLGCNVYADDWDGTNSNLFLGVGVCGAGNMSGAIGSVFLGYQTGYSITSGDYNIFLGYQAGRSNLTGAHNFIAGYQAGYYNQTGIGNVLMGHRSGFGVSGQSNSYNVILGHQAGYSITTGSSSIFVGHNAGYYETVGSKLYITNQQGSNEADGRAKALLYGVMSATTANQTLLINAVVTFAYFPVTPSAAPTTDYQVANKKYVDDNAGGGGGFDTDFAGSMSADQTIATSTLTKLSIDTADRDNNSEFDAVNDRFKCKVAGTYRFTYGVRFAANATGYRNIFLRVNAVATYYGGVQILPVSATVECNTQGSYSLWLEVDEWVEACVYQNCGGNLDAKSHNASFIMVHRIR